MIRWSVSPLSSLRAVLNLTQNWKSPPLRRRVSAALSPAASHLTTRSVPGTHPPPVEMAMDSPQNDATQFLSKNAQKRLLKQQRQEANKAEKKARMKEHKRRELERKRREWQERLDSVGEEERERMVEVKRALKKERMEKQSEERGRKMERLQEARINGRNVVIDLEFSHLMNSFELHSLVQQIVYCYAMNRRCALPAHIWLTGCRGEMQNQLVQIPGYDKWVLEKEDRHYIDIFQDQKENLVYLTADSKNVLDDLDPKAIYIIGGLVDRNRLKHVTMNKAIEQGIKTAKLPIGTYMKMSSSEVLTVNQVVEILLKFLATKDWKESFFQAIPLRKKLEGGSCDSEEDFELKHVHGDDSERVPRTVEQATQPEDGGGEGDRHRRLQGAASAGMDDQMLMRQCIDALPL